MGLLLDLSTLALSSVVRDASASSTSFPKGAALERWLGQRLADGNGELLRVVRQVCEQSWQALEVVLTGDTLYERHRWQAPARVLGLLGEVNASIPADQVLPADERRGCLEELRTARRRRVLIAGSCDANELAASVAALLALDGAELRAEEEKAVLRIFDHVMNAGYYELSQLISATREEPLVVLAARTFLRQRINRDPKLLWGPSYTEREPPARRQRRGLLSLDDLQTHYPEQLEQWLLELGGFSTGKDDMRGGVLLEAMDVEEEAAAPLLEDMDVEEEAAAPPPRARASAVRRMDMIREVGTEEEAAPGKKDLRRRANVRWFRRMNPLRMYPLTVVLAKGRIKQVKVKGVEQAVSKEQLVVTADNPFITVRPVLPGVKVYPPEQTVDVTPDTVSVRFHVVPSTPGDIPDARIEFYWRQRLVSQIDLPMKVTRQVVAIMVSSAGIVWPFLANAAKSMGADEQAQDFIMQGLLAFLRWPYAVEAGMAFTALLAVFFWWINRPKETSDETDVLKVKPMSLQELLAEGHRALLLNHWDEARSYFEDAVNVAPDNAEARHGLKQAQDRNYFLTLEMTS